MQAIKLDRESHIYSPNLPSVTSILQGAGLVDASYYTDEGKQRGSMVHLALQYLDEGDLDESSIDPEIAGYVESYKKFKEISGYAPEWIELPMKDPAGVYAGTPDRIMVTRPRSLDDIKTGDYQPWHRLQTAAYVNMLEDPFSYERRCIYLKKDGGLPKVEVFPKAEYTYDLTVFLSCINIANWRERHYGSRPKRD